jgi:two-component system chemotaxis response regulator CheY
MFKPDDELVNSYLDECRELLATMEEGLLDLEADGAEFNEERINRIVRAVHSVKGGAEIFNLEKIAELAHSTESALALVRSRKLAPRPDRIRTLLRAMDGLNALVRDAGASVKPDNRLNTRLDNRLISELKSLCDQGHPLVHNSATADPSPQPSRNLRVLLVEDDFACRLLLQTFLSRYGDCHIAVNGREAVDAFCLALDQEKPYHLICMDIMMPEMNGREAVRQIRAMEEARGIRSTCGARIFMTTTVDEVKEVFLCFKELCDAYFIKPIELKQLLNQMEFYQMLK